MATVNLRVVGIYMDVEVDIDLNRTEPVTVKDVMEEYSRGNPIDQPGGFRFEDEDPRSELADSKAKSPTLMEYHLPSFLITKGRRFIRSGIYKLEEPKEEVDPFQAFQYYVLEDLGERGVRNKSKGQFGFRYYNQSPDWESGIEDGDTIIWRQVSVALNRQLRLILPNTMPQSLTEEQISQLRDGIESGAIAPDELEEAIPDSTDQRNREEVTSRIQQLLDRI